jgi:hypothetical protein
MAGFGVGIVCVCGNLEDFFSIFLHVQFEIVALSLKVERCNKPLDWPKLSYILLYYCESDKGL